MTIQSKVLLLKAATKSKSFHACVLFVCFVFFSSFGSSTHTRTFRFKSTWRRKKIKRLNGSNPWLRHFYCHHDRDSALTQRPLSPLHRPLKCVIHSTLENKLLSSALLAPGSFALFLSTPDSIYFTCNHPPKIFKTFTCLCRLVCT